MTSTDSRPPLQVKRIIANIAATDVTAAQRFYGDILGLDRFIDHGWIATYGSATRMSVQVSIATEGGAGTHVPGLSVEVDDLDEALSRVARAGMPPIYGPVDEPWGVRRFFVRDPFGTLVNILAHSGTA